ncbi:MAG: thioredoxin domain-containing protein [bacterium]
MANRLIHETSPYLLQHAHNPVDWYPWGAEAFERAKKEDKPVFLSIGYSSCHWCHVMERESFENDDVAKILNEHFVCIKVDREERQDIDEIYMTATQLMTGRGGWPNSVWLLPDGRPWFAGTYFPREDIHGRAGFKTLLLKLADFWKTRRGDAEKQADQLAAAIRQSATASGTGAEAVTAQSLRNLVTLALGEAQRSYDANHGGFGGAPKFPPHALLALLLEEVDWTRDKSLLGMVTGTLDAMALGGIHDHVGGGFHRYATDERWFLPHFEKMLYDSAQLARVYAEAYRVTSNASYAAVARDTCDWVLREMTGKEGGFYSALDADSEGVEGKFYVWTRDEIIEVLGEEEGTNFCAAYNITAGGNYHEESTGESTGSNIPFLKQLPAVDFSAARQKLLARRVKRVWPGLDDKVLTAWNGLMIGALARAGTVLDEPRYLDAAKKAASFILSDMQKDGQLLRSYRAGAARIPAYLDDYVFLANGLLDLHEATGETGWRDHAVKLLGIVSERFRDERGGFFYASVDHEQLLARTKDPFDQAVPSANAVAALVLLRLDDIDGAARCLHVFMPMLQRGPTGAGTFILVAARCADRMSKSGPTLSARKGPVRVAVALSPTAAPPGATLDLAVKLAIDEGWHINAHKPDDKDLVPTSVSIETNGIFALKQVDYPKGTKPLKGALVIGGKIGVAKDAPGGTANIDITIAFQPCDETRCLKPENITIQVPFAVVER